MTRLATLATTVVACLAASTFTGTVSAQSSTNGSPSAGGSAASTATGTGSSSSNDTATMTSGATYSSATAPSAANGTRGSEPFVTVEGMVPAYANGTKAALEATIEAVWSTESARGALTQGLATLLAADNSTVYGVVLEFNETTANMNYSSTLIPWIATISCDSASQSYTLPASEYNGNGTMTSGNGTTSSNETVRMDLLQQAQDLGAKAILMYSSRTQSCTLNTTSMSGNSSDAATGSNSSTSVTIPVFSAGSQDVATIILQQLMNVAEGHRYFNSTLLTASTSNLTQALETATQSGRLSGTLNSIVTDYLLARINPTYNASDSSNGVVATIGRAPSSSATSSSNTAATGSASQGSNAGNGSPSSGAARDRCASKVTLAAVGFSAGAMLAGLGLVL